MSRTRMIKPGFFKHAELYEAELATRMPLRVAFAGLWTVADRAGRFRWKIDLKPDVLPFDQVDMLKVLDALEQHGFIRSYVVDGKRYGLIPSFGSHQTFHHTEKHSTIPAPVFNGEPTVPLLADTVAVTGTVTELEDDDLAPDSVQVPEPSELTAIYLSIWANKAVAEKWGEQPSPYTHGSATSITDALRNLGVEWKVARRSMYRQCRESKQRVPPRGINYFRQGIEADWEAELARRSVAASGEKPPPPEETARPTGAAAGRRADPGAEAFAKIRGLVRTHPDPRQGTSRHIPRTEVEKLGAPAVAAYDAVGGASRVLAGIQDPKSVGFLLKEFSDAFAAATREN